eukprot:TRINITY_DN7207_c1_g1_i1.p1 TRINITY_DN7207_c1_g1~~TRINITY_DN7207_c1_g1_i1.p1  ORF type:complete len:148 (+),score=13.57 TRINITY_DN7207_c1_g1_i1:44-487(+)
MDTASHISTLATSVIRDTEIVPNDETLPNNLNAKKFTPSRGRIQEVGSEREDLSKVTLLHLMQSRLVPVGSILSCISEENMTEYAKLTHQGTVVCQKSNTEFKTLTSWVTSVALLSLPLLIVTRFILALPKWKRVQIWMVLCTIQQR